MGRLGRDPYVVAGTILVVLPLIVYAVPSVPSGAKGVFSGHVSDLLFIALASGAVFSAVRRASTAGARRFWTLVGAGLALWAAAALLQFFAFLLGLGDGVQRVVDSLYLLSYVTWFLAADQRPHVAASRSTQEPSFRYATAGGMLFVVGLIAYFEMLPAVGLAPRAISTSTDVALFISLDFALALRFALASWRSAPRRV